MTCVLTMMALSLSMEPVSRINHGVVFQPQRTIHQSTNHFYCTFVIQKPNISMFDPIFQGLDHPCPRGIGSRYCHTFQRVVTNFIHRNNNTITRTRSLAKDINLLGSTETELPASRRSKRNIIGDIISSITGLVTKAKLQKFGSQIDALETGKINAVNKKLIVATDELHAMSILTNHRITNLFHLIHNSNRDISHLFSGIQILHDYLDQQSREINTTYLELQRLSQLVNFQFHISDRSAFLNDLLDEFKSHLNGMHVLLSGYLPLEFVNYHLLRTTLSGIRSHLLTISPDFEITHSDLKYYYTHPNVIFHQSHKYLYLRLTIPLSAVDSKFQIYRVLQFAIPSPENIQQGKQNSTLESSFTTVGTLPQYFGISVDGVTFMELTSADLAHCSSDKNDLYCSMPFTIYNSIYPSCVYSIFIDDQETITTNCRINILIDYVPQPKATFISETRALVQGHANWTLTCRNEKPIPLTNCKLCMVTTNCNCRVHSKWVTLQPTLSNCNNSSGELMVQHITNLHFIRAIFPRYDTSNITGYTTFSSPWKAELPVVSMVSRSFNHSLAVDKSIVLDLNKIATKHHIEEQLFATQIDQLSYESEPNYDLYSTPLKYLAQVFSPTVAIGVIMIIFCIVTTVSLRRQNRQIRNLTLMITASKLAPCASSSPTLYLHENTTPSPNDNDNDNDWSSYFPTEHLITILVVIIGLVLFYGGRSIIHKVLYKLTPNSFISCNRKAYIVLEISNISDSIYIRVKDVSLPILRIVRTARKPIRSAYVKMGGFLTSSFLIVSWQTVQILISDQNITEKLLLPSTIRIPIGYTKRLRAIINSRFYTRLLIGEPPIYTVIPIVESLDQNSYEYLRSLPDIPQ